MQGLQYPQYEDVSVKFLFSHEVFRGAGIHSRFGPQLIAAYHLKVVLDNFCKNVFENYSSFSLQKMQDAIDFSGIRINFKIHCIAYSAGTDRRTRKKFEDMNTAEYLKFFNDKSDTSHFEELRSDADLLFMIRTNTGDQSSISIFNGVRYSETSILIGEDFIFDKYTLLHEMGHVFGCAHQENTEDTLKPLIMTSFAKIMFNGYCGIMVNPMNRKCKPGLFYSNPEVKYQGVRTGSFNANNALWIHNNRFAVANVGKEKLQCPNKNIFNLKMVEAMVNSSQNNHTNFDSYAPNFPKWGRKRRR